MNEPLTTVRESAPSSLEFTTHTIASAPEGSRRALTAAAAKTGEVPVLLARMAESPGLVDGFFRLIAIFDASSLDAIEREVVILATAFENECRFCMAMHSMLLAKAGGSPELVEALRTGAELPDAKLAALAELTRGLVRGRGDVDEVTRARFRSAGYEPRHALDVVIGIAQQTASNYASHLVGAPLDPSLEAFRWLPPRLRVA